MARRTPPEENIPLIVYKPFVWRSGPPPKSSVPSDQHSSSASVPQEPLPSPFPQHCLAAKYDGYLVGNGHVYRPGTPLGQVRGVMPPGGHPTQKIIFVNGILNSPDNHYDSLTEIAKNANAEVVGIYNATEGPVKDVWQCIKDKLGIGYNPAVGTLRDTLYAELISSSHQPINLMAHSQGALITSRALSEVANRLQEAGLSRDQVQERMSRINVDTFGGAAWTYPNGPHYNHYANALDPVASMFGQNTLPRLADVVPPVGIAAELGVIHNPGGGAGSHQHAFAGVALNPHAFTDVYLKHWQSQFPRDAPQP